MLQKREKTVFFLIIILSILIFYLFIAWAVPYSSTDDYQWGMDQGIRWWRYGLLNNRYLGNLCAVLMCHYQLIKTFLMGGCMFAIPFFMTLVIIPSVSNERTFLFRFFLCNSFILLMPPIMWIEIYGWVSGFGNYGVSATVFLGFLFLIQIVYQQRKYLKTFSLVFFITALIMGLFVETLSILFVGVTLVMGIYATVWDKPLRLPFWSSIAGTLIAAIIMFSNNVVLELLDTGSALQGLRTLTFAPRAGIFTIVGNILRWYFQKLLPISFLRGIHIALPMAIIVFLGFWNSRFRPLSILGTLPFGCFYLIWSTEDYTSWSLLGCLCWGLTFLALIVEQCNSILKIRRILLFLVAPLALLPLAATTTLGQRFYFLPTLVLIILASELIMSLPFYYIEVSVVTASLIMLMLLWGYRAVVTNGCNLLWERQISDIKAQKSDSIILPTDKYTRVFYTSRNPWNAESASYFRQFYGIEDNVTLIFLPSGSYEKWPDYTQKQWDERVEFLPSNEFTSSLP